ncbi:MAG: hypothetical protein ACIWVG_31230, partial [Gloeotrichia echinulata HAB0833]
MVATFNSANPQITLPILSALKQYEELQSVLHIHQANSLQLEEKLNLANEDYQVAKNRFDRSEEKRQILIANLNVLANNQAALDTAFSNQKAVIQAGIASIQSNLSDAIARLHIEADSAQRDAIFKEINGYYVQIQQEQNLLSLIYGDYQQDLAVVSFKINQVTSDLQELDNTIIPTQKQELNNKHQYLMTVSHDLETTKQAVTSSEKN